MIISGDLIANTQNIGSGSRSLEVKENVELKEVQSRQAFWPQPIRVTPQSKCQHRENIQLHLENARNRRSQIITTNDRVTTLNLIAYNHLPSLCDPSCAQY